MAEEKDVNKKRKLNDGTVAAIRKLWSDDSILQEFAEWVIQNGGFLADCLSIQRGTKFPFLTNIFCDESSTNIVNTEHTSLDVYYTNLAY